MVKVGYDIDGVLTNGFIREKPYVLITGRTINQWEDTIYDFGHLHCPVYLRPFGLPEDQKAAAEWKMNMINWIGLDKYYEDNPEIVRYLKRNCPHTTIVQVNA